MPQVRPPAVAGRFYPGEPRALRAAVRRYLDMGATPGHERAGTAPAPPSRPAALVAPHAGYAYSGPVAGSAYAALAAGPYRPRRVVVVAPAHHAFLSGSAVPSSSAFATPLGDVPLDGPALQRARSLPGVEVDDRAHAPEHAIEVQLPFLQEILGPDFRLLPLLVGSASDDEASEVLDGLWDEPDTLVVVSTDLSHYLSHDEAARQDAGTADAVKALEPERIGPEDACGARPLRALLRLARRRGLFCRTLDLRTSGDTGGPRDVVVGYGAFVLAASPAAAARTGAGPGPGTERN